MRSPVVALLTCLVWLPGASLAEFIEGRHYLEIPFGQPVENGDKIEVREFFWYGCPHCYTLEPNLEKWLKRKPDNVWFIRTPGTGTRWLTHARTFFAFEALGVTDKLHGPFFDAIHRGSRPLNEVASIAEFVAAQDVDPESFRKAYNSFGVRLKLKKTTTLNKTYEVNSVPQLTVDGKYRTSPALAGGNDAAIQVLDFLIKKAAAERQQARTPH